MSSSRPYIGGQAVLEGVMMRAPKSFAVVVRRSDGSLMVRERAMRTKAGGVARWPLVRGVASVVESLKLGSEALRFSVDQMSEDLSRDAAANHGSGGLGVLAAFGLSLFAMATRDDGDLPPPSRTDHAAAGHGDVRRPGIDHAAARAADVPSPRVVAAALDPCALRLRGAESVAGDRPA
jgi:hypothetical protein